MQANLLSQPSEISQSRRAWAWPLCRCLVKAAVAASALLVFTAGFFWFFQDTTSGMSWMQALQHAATLFALFTSASFVMVFRQCQERTQLHQQLAECHTQLQQLQRQHADHTTHQQSLVELISEMTDAAGQPLDAVSAQVSEAALSIIQRVSDLDKSAARLVEYLHGADFDAVDLRSEINASSEQLNLVADYLKTLPEMINTQQQAMHIWLHPINYNFLLDSQPSEIQ